MISVTKQVLAPDGNVSVPPPPAKPEEATPKADGRADKSRTAGLERPEELVPELIKFLQSHPEIKALPKAVQVHLPYLASITICMGFGQYMDLIRPLICLV